MSTNGSDTVGGQEAASPTNFSLPADDGENHDYGFNTDLPDFDAMATDITDFEFMNAPSDVNPESLQAVGSMDAPSDSAERPEQLSSVPDASEVVQTIEMRDAQGRAPEDSDPTDEADAPADGSNLDPTTAFADAEADDLNIDETAELSKAQSASVTPIVAGEDADSLPMPIQGSAPAAPMTGRQLNLGNSMLGNKDKATAMQQKFVARFRNKQQAHIEDRSPSPPTAQRARAEILMPPPPARPRQDPSATPQHQPGENSADAEAAKFKALEATYLRKKKAGTLSITEEIEFMKAEASERARQRKLEADAAVDRSPSPEIDEESGLFVAQSDDDALSSHQPTYGGMDSSDEDERAVPTSARTQRRSRKRRGTLLDDHSVTTATTTTRGRKAIKTSKKSAARRGVAESDDGFVGDVLAKHERLKKSKAAEANGKGGKNVNAFDKRSLANVNTIRGTNVFRDAQRNAHRQEQPGFTKRRKADALAELIASVPEENRKVASADKKFLAEACKMFNGLGSVHPSLAGDGTWTMKGMKSTLKHYQVLGAAFMRRRENEEKEPRGGILADEMGLGKTVEMLANIVNGKPRGDTTVRCTLIVASPALCAQWHSEINKHVQTLRENKKWGLGDPIQHRAGHRLGGNDENVQEMIENADICLTTYGDICKSYPKAIVPTHLTTAAQKDAWWREYFEENKGVFHRIRFLRIVLDEAQAIKNHKGHTSLACSAVMAQHHWAITGTPIMNRLSEFYPYFKFLREPSTGSFKIFKENFCSPDDPEGAIKLAIFLRKVMIRRTHIDTLFGARLLDLPRPKQQVCYLAFNETERQIYEIVKSRFIQRINSIAKQENGVANHYNHIFTMILRLRQLCSHILLIKDTIVDLLKREDFEKLNALSQRYASTDEQASILLHLRQVLQKSMEDEDETVEAGAASTIIPVADTARGGATVYADDIDEDLVGGRHGLSFNFGKYLNQIANSEAFEQIRERSTCCACRQQPDNPHITSCYHIYCLDCIDLLQHNAARHGRDAAACQECGSEYTSVKKCTIGPTDYQQSTAVPSDASSTYSGIGGRSKKSKKKSRDEDDPDSDWVGMKGEVLPSTKTVAVKAQIQTWFYENPDCKIIIYTQFLPVVRIMSKICETERWGHQKYTGQMSQDARNRAINNFSEDPGARILLASLRCGGLGLNLTMATHVILIDPWWNTAVEQQAFCRVFRIGQTKETRLTRFVVENTVDAAMMQMKDRKEKEIDEVMENPNYHSRLSPEDLMRLFGKVGEDENGRPFIFPGNDEDDAYRFRDPADEDNEDFRQNGY